MVLQRSAEVNLLPAVREHEALGSEPRLIAQRPWRVERALEAHAGGREPMLEVVGHVGAEVTAVAVARRAALAVAVDRWLAPLVRTS